MPLKAKKKILQLRSNVGFYGAERVVLELAKGLCGCGQEAIVGIIHNMRNPHDDFERMARRARLPVRVFRSRSPLDWRTIRDIRTFVSKENIDVIHSHGYKADVYAWLACRHSGSPLVSTCHPWLETETNWKAKFYAELDKIILSRFNQVIAISEKVKKEYQSGPFSKKPVEVIENGIDLGSFAVKVDREELCRKLSLPLDARVIGAVGRLSPEKGYDLLLQAFARLKWENDNRLILMLVGDGPERKKLQALGKKLNVTDRLFFLGAQEDVPALLSLMEVFALSSLSEGVPMALLEAMAAGRAIVATDVGEVKEIIGCDGGLVIQPNDVAGLTDSMRRLLLDRQMAQKCAEKARQRIVQNYSSDIMVARYIDNYERLLNYSIKAL